MLEIRDLVKVYPSGTKAIDGVSLDIQRGEFVVLMGLSGSGKSSLLRCINRLVEPTSGRIVFDGADVTRAPSNTMRPLVGSTRRLMHRSSDDLPEPESPMRTTNSPRWMSRETPSIAFVPLG